MCLFSFLSDKFITAKLLVMESYIAMFDNDILKSDINALFFEKLF